MAEPGDQGGSETPEGGTPPEWSRLHLWQIQWVRDVLIAIGILALFWLGQEISIVTVPLLLALLLAYLFEPVIEWLMRRSRLKRQGAVSAIIAGVIVLVVIPSALGISYGTFQAIGIVGRVADKSTIVWNSVESGRRVSTLDAMIAEARRARARADARERRGEGAEEPDAEPQQPQGPTDDAGGDRAGAQEAGAEEAPGGFLFGFGDDGQGEDELLTEAAISRLEDELGEAESKRDADLERLRTEAPRWRELRDFLVEQHEAGSLDEGFQALQQWIRANAEQLAGAAAATGVNVIERTLRFFAGAAGLVFMIFLTGFFFFFMSTGWIQVKDFAAKLMPERNRDMILHLLKEFDRVISAFIRGRLTIAFIQSIVFTVGYTVIGVPAAFILGPVIAVLSIVPYLALVGLPVSVFLLFVENHTGLRGHWLWVLGAPTVFYFVAQALDDYVWTPWIQGKTTDMSTPMILFASLAGGVLFGFFGLLIAIPIAACIKILVQEIFWPRFKAWTEGEEEDFLPISRERRKS